MSPGVFMGGFFTGTMLTLVVMSMVENDFTKEEGAMRRATIGVRSRIDTAVLLRPMVVRTEEPALACEAMP